MLSSSTDRDNLLGLLAVRNELLSPEALAAATVEWRRDRSRSLGQVLVESGACGRRKCRRSNCLPSSTAAATAPTSGRWPLMPPSNRRPTRPSLLPPLPRRRRQRPQQRPLPGAAAPRQRRPRRGLRRPRRGVESRGRPQGNPGPDTPTIRRAVSVFCWKRRSPAGWNTPVSCPSTVWAVTPTADPTTPCGSSRATACCTPSSASTPTTA